MAFCFSFLEESAPILAHYPAGRGAIAQVNPEVYEGVKAPL
jgi:hypothetical protein